MSDRLNTNTNSNIRSFFKRTLLDPVLLYGTLVMMTIMHHYRDISRDTISVTAMQKLWENISEYGNAVRYGILTYILGWVLFRFLDFVNRHHVIGFFAYIAVSVGWLMLSTVPISIGRENYAYSWGLWFFTPQDSIDYNGMYAFALYMMLFGFLLSVIYYFTRVRYRILMNFVIFLIPFTIYGKEYAKMPIGFIILMVMAYLLIMVYFRSLSGSDTVKIIDQYKLWHSVAVYAVIFAVISTAFPKPVVEEDRTYLESLMNADAFSDKLVAMLEAFQDKSNGEQFRGRQSNETDYFVQSRYPVHLKTSTFSYYDFETDAWSVSDIDSYYGTREIDDYPIQFPMNQCVGDAILRAAELDGDFAERYGLAEYKERSFRLPVEEELRIWPNIPNAQTMPVPGYAQFIESSKYQKTIDAMRSGTIYTEDGSFSLNDLFIYKYLPEGFIYSGDNRELLGAIEKVTDYEQMLQDAKNILADSDSDEDTKYYDVVSNNAKYYPDYLADLMDYGGDSDIEKLAREITEGCITEVEKAQAIEMYFFSNNYIYNQEYVKAKGENVHDFLFTTKTGVCYEYATAMTLIARAAGIPARFCEGYNVQQPLLQDTRVRDYWGAWYTLPAVADDGLKTYDVTGLLAHGYPELYIRGYGWAVFEPTVSNSFEDGTKRSTTVTLTKAGLYMLVIALVGLLLLLSWSELSHRVFRHRNAKREPDKAVVAAMLRICRLYGTSKAMTSHETADIVAARSGADITETARLFDKTVYGGITPDENDRNKVMEEYCAAFDALKEAKKNERKQKRMKVK